jgi:hypothetical protein
VRFANSKIPRYFMETGLVVNAVVTMYSTLISSRRLIGSITSRQAAIIGISFDSLRSRETEKSESM